MIVVSHPPLLSVHSGFILWVYESLLREGETPRSQKYRKGYQGQTNVRNHQFKYRTFLGGCCITYLCLLYASLLLCMCVVLLREGETLVIQNIIRGDQVQTNDRSVKFRNIISLVEMSYLLLMLTTCLFFPLGGWRVFWVGRETLGRKMARRGYQVWNSNTRGQLKQQTSFGRSVWLTPEQKTERIQHVKLSKKLAWHSEYSANTEYHSEFSE